MVIAGEVVALQHQRVSDMLSDMLPQIKSQSIEKARAKLTVGKVSLSGITRERVIKVMRRTEATIKASRVMLWTETTMSV